MVNKFKCLICEEEFNTIEEVIEHLNLTSNKGYKTHNLYKLLGTNFNLSIG